MHTGGQYRWWVLCMLAKTPVFAVVNLTLELDIGSRARNRQRCKRGAASTRK